MSRISKEPCKLDTAVSDEVDMARRLKELQADKFKLTLNRLSGETTAVTIDDMCEFMIFVQNNGVHDLSFVDEAYKSIIFSDDEFLESIGIIVCSVDQFVVAWEEAKEKKDAAILKLFRDVHRKARTFLVDPDIKNRIKECDRMREQANLYKDYNDLILMSAKFARKHLHNPATSYLMEDVIPHLSGLVDRMNFAE